MWPTTASAPSFHKLMPHCKLPGRKNCWKRRSNTWGRFRPPLSQNRESPAARRLPRLERPRPLPEILRMFFARPESVAQGPHSGPAAVPVARAQVKMSCRGRPRVCPSSGHPQGVPLRVRWGTNPPIANRGSDVAPTLSPACADLKVGGKVKLGHCRRAFKLDTNDWGC